MDGSVYYQKAADTPPAVAAEIARWRDRLLDADAAVDDARRRVDDAVRDRDDAADQLTRLIEFHADASAVDSGEAGTDIPAPSTGVLRHRPADDDDASQQ